MDAFWKSLAIAAQSLIWLFYLSVIVFFAIVLIITLEVHGLLPPDFTCGWFRRC